METVFEHNIKLDNNVITKLLKQNDKRALFIYTYALRWNIERVFVPTPISFILELLGKGSAASNNKSIKNSLKALIGMKLIKVYSEITLKNEVDIDSLNKNDLMYIVAKESLSENNYTLVKAKYVDMVMINESNLEREDMMAIVLLLSRNIERKDEVLKVCWYSSDKLSKELRIRKLRYFELIEGLKELEVIYYEKLMFEEKKKEHLIYSMFEDREQVGMAIEKAKVNGVLNIRAKLVKSVQEYDNDILIPYFEDEELIGYGVKTFTDEVVLKRILEVNVDGIFMGFTGIELNTGSAKVVNEIYKQFGKGILLKALETIGLEVISGKGNPTGYMIKMLPIRTLEIKKAMNKEQSA